MHFFTTFAVVLLRGGCFRVRSKMVENAVLHFEYVHPVKDFYPTRISRVMEDGFLMLADRIKRRP